MAMGYERLAITAFMKGCSVMARNQEEGFIIVRIKRFIRGSGLPTLGMGRVIRSILIIASI